jgi:hypothetical protein
LLGATSDAAKSRVKGEAEARAGELRGAAMDAVDMVKEEVASAVNGDGRDATAESQPAAGSSALS